MAKQNSTEIKLSVIDQFGVPRQIEINADAHFKAMDEIDQFLADVFAGQNKDER